jgi:2-polyprenyl-3-methyl-5-hydroxy-6-metoxy-1,4-benzoquinol methylase
MSGFAWVLATDVWWPLMSKEYEGTEYEGTQYDAIAREYQATKESPLRLHIEAFSFFDMLGDPAGLRVLDLACGEGFYTRAIAKRGAKTVTGVDISAEMIALAKELEGAEPLGIDYHCADVAALATELPELGRFDLVSAAYLMHYSPDVSALRAMCEQIVAHLEPGGRFVCINENPEQTFAQHAGYTQYGFNKLATADQVDGARMTYAMVSGRQMIRFDVFYYTRATYEAVLRAAGFKEVRWLPLQLDPVAVEKYGTEYWQEYMSNPPVTGLVCTL